MSEGRVGVSCRKRTERKMEGAEHRRAADMRRWRGGGKSAAELCIIKRGEDMPKAKYDWGKIELEYIRGNMTGEVLCKKYQISKGTFESRSAERKFSEKRRKYQESVQEKALARACAREAKALSRILGAAEKAAALLDKHMKDEDTLKNWLYTDKETGEPNEKRLKKLDTKAVREMTGAMRDTVAALTMMAERKDKQQTADKQGSGGVILLPERDEDEEETEDENNGD